MRSRFFAFGLTILITVATTLSLILQGLNLGLDFTGGIMIEAHSETILKIEDVRARLSAAGIEDASIQSVDSDKGVLIRLPAVADDVESEQTNKIVAAMGDGVEILRVDMVGPAVSGELLRKGLIATGLAIAMISVYVWFRFEAKFGIAAFLTTFHDVYAVLGLFSLTRMNFDLTIVAALLTIAGYSINDTVIVFDRIRENLTKHKRIPMPEIIDRSVTETLRRTVTTSATTMMTSLALLIFGGPVLFGFATAISFGIIIGTYSSIFVAAPLLIYLPGRLPGNAGTGPAPVAEG